jgi:N4-gp56 family major capsid protein
MSITSFSRSEEGNVVLLREKMEREAWYSLFFSRFAGFTTKDKVDGSLIPSGSPIEILRDFAAEGSDSMLLAMLKRLTGTGVSGDAQLKGNEERMNVYYQKVYINQKRHGTKVGGRISNQRMKKFNLIAKAQPLLSDWLAQWMEFNFLYTFFHGYSPHILENITTGGLYITSGQKICHPNFYCAGSGFSTWNATAATYEGTLDDDVSGVTDTSTDHLSCELLEDLRVQTITKKIMPMVSKEGIEFWPMLIHPQAAKQLRKDSDWKNAQKDARIRGVNNPLFTGALGEYAGFVLYERMMMPGIYPAGTSSSVTIGATNPLSALDTYDRKMGLIFGRGAIAHGWALGPYIDEDDEDYKNNKGVAIGIIGGSARAEYKDNSTDGSNTAVVNQSSIAFTTYSP